jgi:hypothetical protein
MVTMKKKHTSMFGSKLLVRSLNTVRNVAKLRENLLVITGPKPLVPRQRIASDAEKPRALQVHILGQRQPARNRKNVLCVALQREIFPDIMFRIKLALRVQPVRGAAKRFLRRGIFGLKHLARSQSIAFDAVKLRENHWDMCGLKRHACLPRIVLDAK